MVVLGDSGGYLSGEDGRGGIDAAADRDGDGLGGGVGLGGCVGRGGGGLGRGGVLNGGGGGGGGCSEKIFLAYKEEARSSRRVLAVLK